VFLNFAIVSHRLNYMPLGGRNTTFGASSHLRSLTADAQ
jgi:hypothetical protein